MGSTNPIWRRACKIPRGAKAQALETRLPPT
jgi:hypothetical protein